MMRKDVLVVKNLLRRDLSDKVCFGKKKQKKTKKKGWRKRGTESWHDGIWPHTLLSFITSCSPIFGVFQALANLV